MHDIDTWQLFGDLYFQLFGSIGTTQRQGGDPDKWSDVRERLPLLAKKKWYETTRHGYARGQEPVTYVDNVRTYYEMLRWRFPAHLPSAEAPYGLEIDPRAL